MPLDEILPIARQIAEALEAAHERGVVHRDLKPANVMITPTGLVKVLDFGLAAMAQPGPSAPGDPTNSPTLTMGMTQAGVIMGTAAYMAPEQAAGTAVDKRADIWSFGVVLFEMLSGQRLFSGDTVAHTLADVLRAPIEFEKVTAPAPLKNLLRRCLDRNVTTRLRDIGEARIALLNPVDAPAPEPVTIVQIQKEPASKLPWIAAAAATLALLALAAWTFYLRPAAPAHVVKTTVTLPEGITQLTASPPAVSPDGRRIVFVGIKDGARALWVRDLDALEARLLPGTETAARPFWAPDSRWVAFFAAPKLKKIDVTGGPAVSITDVRGNGAGAWGANDMIVFTDAPGAGLLRVPAVGGTPTKIADSASATWFLPDGRHFLYTGTTKEDTESAMYIGDIQASEADNSKNRRALVRTGSNSAYAEPGYLLFVREGTLMAQPFDPSKLATTGDAVPAAEHVSYTGNLPTPARFSVSRNGVLVYVSGGADENSRLTWFDRSGKNLGTIGNPGFYGALAISPDGSRVAAEKREGGNGDLWLIDAAPGGKNDRFTFGLGQTTSPVWSPDGSQIVFAANPGGGVLNLFKKPSNLTGKEEELFKSPENKNAIDWSRDGKTLSFSPYAPASDVWTLNLSDKKAALFFKTDNRDIAGHFSPDGHWLAYSSEVTGRLEVYVRPFPANEAGGQQMVSLGGGGYPLWRRDGKELYYRSLGNKVMAVAVTPAGSLSTALKFGQPKELFSPGTFAPTNGPYYEWDATADGSKFLINLVGTEASQAATPLTLVQNWTAGLK
jgi:eukaryotic-like serine/threonine-protein kinase